MSTVIMLFVLPLGIIVYIWDRKVQKENLDTFNSYIVKIKNSELEPKDKLLRIDEMLYNNGYNQAYMSEDSLTMEKKHFNVGALFISLGVAAYFGILAYMIYYKFFLKPNQISVCLTD